jgi:lipoprotein NlpD
MSGIQRFGRFGGAGAWIAALVALSLTAGCGAPGPLIPGQRPDASAESRPPPAPESYRVRVGDTLYSIAFRYGLDWRRVAEWNRIDAPYTIHVDDRIRLRPPPDMRPAVAPGRSSAPAGRDAGEAAGTDTAEPVSARPSTATPQPAPAAGDGAAAAMEPERAEAPAADAPTGSDEARPPDPPGAPSRRVAGVHWRWPTDGELRRRFDADASRKGILVGGDTGQPVRAAADGEVVYSGDGLIGYGQLIIIKHSEAMLSAYGHNRERLVAEGDRVQAGQLVARMGRDERDEAVLHFEIRRDGRPDDPLDYLPDR